MTTEGERLVRAWTTGVLRRAGNPKDAEGRGRAILEAMSRQSPIRESRDSDDLFSAGAAAARSVGDDWRPVFQESEGGEVLHVICEVWDAESGTWKRLEGRIG